MTKESQGERANRHRIRLLRKKYGGHNLSRAEEYALEYWTARTRMLLPNVTAADWKALDDMMARADARRAKSKALYRDLGL